MNNTDYKTISLAILACLLWSTAFVGIKVGLKYTTPIQFAGIRFMISGLMILPFVKLTHDELRLLYVNRYKVIQISVFQTFGLYSLFYIGISKTPASVTALIIGASPLFIAVMASFVSAEPLTRKKIWALITGMAGIVIISFARFGSAIRTSYSILGIVILLFANLSGSFGNILVSKYRTGISPLLLNAVQIFMGGLALLILSFFIEGFKFGQKPLPYYFSLLWLSFISAMAFSLWFIILQKPNVKVSEINIWKFLIPVSGAILSWLIIPEESPQINTISGMVLVSLSLIIMNWQKRRKI